MKDAPDLLIDLLLRQTFKKGHRNQHLRDMLCNARRFVLADEMTGFLAELVFESFQGRIMKHRLPKSTKLIFRLLDDIRHFSRLPHRLTWVEWSEHAKWKQLKSIEERCGMPMWSAITDVDAMVEVTKRARYGWLAWQHPKVETSFRLAHFAADPGHDVAPFLLSTFDVVWDTENPNIAFPIDPASNSSAEITATKGWDRQGVGECKTDFIEFRKGRAKDHGHHELRYVWTFLSTINKIPICGQHQVRPSHGFIAQGSYRKFLSHEVITLEVPQKASVRKIVMAVLGDIIRRRAHQVRGHWRDDWRMPKGNKALWIAEHQRGDASIGFVTHDYSVEHKQP